jgi:pimeloyl-ACP methyl ester carboxylesterase
MRRWMPVAILPVLALLALLALLASLLALPPAAATPGGTASASASPAVPRLTWADCDDGFQCATAKVPLDYDRPSGQRISLSLIRLPAGDPAHRLGSVFVNPGGPGGSGVDFVRAAGRILFSAQVRARFDLVGFDPRGIIGSTPVRCFDTFDQSLAATAPFPFPVTRAEERTWIGFDRKLATACARHGGAIQDHMATADVARDLDLLRQAVGDRKLTYVGYSYGSYLGATYANLFPGKVRSLIVDGVLDPVAWATGRGDQARTVPFTTRLRSAEGSDATLRGFLRLCDRGGENCAFSAGNPAKRYDRLAKRLLRHPLQLPDGQGGTVAYTYANLVADTLGAMYDPSSWPTLAELLQQLDTLSQPATALAAARSLRVHLGAYQQEDYDNVVEGFPAVVCTDSLNPRSASAWPPAAARDDRANPYFGRPWTWFSSICAQWRARDNDRYLGPFTARTSNPVLVIGNVNDPATPYHGAVTLSRLLPRSRLLTLDGWGHTSLFESSCIDAKVSDYLLTSRVPPAGTVCRPDVIPFAQPAEAATVAASRADNAVLVPEILRRAMRA